MCTNPIKLKKGPYRGYYVPCGKCLECLADKRNEWTFRLQFESYLYTTPPIFITLTYDNNHLHTKKGVNGKDYPVLDKRDVQLFLKRLRERLGYKLRYFLCGEYGETTHRPHYHLILFGNHDKWFDRNLNDFRTDHFQQLVSNTWKNGFVSTSFSRSGALHYCTKYELSASLLEINYLVKPFIMCSAGLGANFLDDVLGHHAFDYSEYQKFVDFEQNHPFDYGDSLSDLLDLLWHVKPLVPQTKVTINGLSLRVPRYYVRKRFGTFQHPDDNPYIYYNQLRNLIAVKIWEFNHDLEQHGSEARLKVLKEKFTKKSKF